MSSVSIQNKHGIAMLIDEEDLGLLSQHREGHWCFCINNRGYAAIRHKRDDGIARTAKLHRVIMDFPAGMQIDHINRNKLDNRKENLRLCTNSQNRMNVIGYGKDSRFKGVYKVKSRWKSALHFAGINTHLGTFTTELEAALAYDTAARLQSCEYRTLNFPDESNND